MIGYESFFQAQLTAGINETDLVIPLDNVPTPSEGFLVIEPTVAANREIIYYTSKGGSSVTVPSGAGNGRGYDGTTAVAHLQNAAVIMAPVAAMFETLQDGTAIAPDAITPEKLLTGAGTSWAWQAWTPTFVNLTGGTLNYSDYVRVGKIVHFRLGYTLAGAGVGGAVTFTVPVTASSEYLTGNILNGSVSLRDATDSARRAGGMHFNSTTVIEIKTLRTDGTYGSYSDLSSTVPFTWAASDTITVEGTYEAA
jgi:hypothetical protein